MKRGSHNGRYILDGKIPVPCEDLLTWAQWMEANDDKRIVKQQDIGPYWVSTVFLGLDHSWTDPELPHLFETMVFTTEHGHHASVDDGYFNRTPTWEMALEAHAEAVAWAKERLQ